MEHAILGGGGGGVRGCSPRKCFKLDVMRLPLVAFESLIVTHDYTIIIVLSHKDW